MKPPRRVFLLLAGALALAGDALLRSAAADPTAPAQPSPLDALDPKAVPDAQRAPWQPKELVLPG